MRYRWAVIGNSRIFRQYMHGAITACGDIVCAALTTHSLQRTNGDDPVPKGISFVDSWETLLSQKPDIIYISNHNDLHTSFVKKALAAKAHILCEKPMAVDLESLESIATEIRSSSITFGVNHHLRFSKLHGELRKIVLSGKYGGLQHIAINHLVELPDFLKAWRTHDKKSGGCTLDITCHDLDLLEYLTDSKVADLELSAVRWNSSGVDVYSSSRGVLENGLLFQLQESFDTFEDQKRIELYFENAKVVAINSLSQKGGGQVIISDRYGASELLEFPEDSLYKSIVTEFRFAISEKRSHAIDVNTGVRHTRNVLKLKQSIDRLWSDRTAAKPLSSIN